MVVWTPPPVSHRLQEMLVNTCRICYIVYTRTSKVLSPDCPRFEHNLPFATPFLVVHACPSAHVLLIDPPGSHTMSKPRDGLPSTSIRLDMVARQPSPHNECSPQPCSPRRVACDWTLIDLFYGCSGTCLEPVECRCIPLRSSCFKFDAT